MSERRVENGTGSDPAGRVVDLERAALGVPGVVRLIPTLSAGLRSAVRRGSGTAGLVVLRVGPRLEVTADLAVDDSRPAVEVAADVEDALCAELADDVGGRPQVTVRVLTIEPAHRGGAHRADPRTP